MNIFIMFGIFMMNYCKSKLILYQKEQYLSNGELLMNSYLLDYVRTFVESIESFMLEKVLSFCNGLQ